MRSESLALERVVNESSARAGGSDGALVAAKHLRSAVFDAFSVLAIGTASVE